MGLVGIMNYDYMKTLQHTRGIKRNRDGIQWRTKLHFRFGCGGETNNYCDDIHH